MSQPSRDRLADLAAFVVRFGWTPTDYYAMTVAERGAILTAARRAR